MLCVGDTKYKIHIGSNSYKIATPYDYEIQWLERTGHQYIDTGVPASNKITKVSVEVFDLLKQSRFIYGAQRDNVRDYLFVWDSNVEIHTRANSNNNHVSFTLTEGFEYELIYTSKDDSTTQREGLTYNGTFLPNRGNYTMDFDNLNLFLFANNFNGVVDFSDGDGMARLRIGKVKIWRSNVLVRDFIPVVKNGIGYMFDKVEKKLYGNLGEGQFGIVEKIPYDYQVEWIGTDGNVLFNTGFIPNTYDITIKARMYYVGFTNNTSWSAWFTAYTDENASTYRIIRNGTSNTAVLMYNGRKAGGGGVSCNVTQNTLYDIEFTSTQLKLNNFSSDFTKSGNVNTATMKMFSAPFKGRMYYFQMYRNGELVVDLIPVVKDNVGCIYDRVSKRLLYNTLTGTVLIGPTI